MPVKDTSLLAITEKQVRSILNKMTKEKFEKLAEQMIEVPIANYEILTMMIHIVYEKAIMEPTFGDIYAELCYRLSQKAKESPFLQIIESDEEPPTEDGNTEEGEGSSSHNTVYRWSNDVGTNDSEVVGPFETIEDCLYAATNPDDCPEPQKRIGEMVLHSVKISQGIFIKIMHPKNKSDELFTVFFPVSKAETIGQQMSEIFLSEVECVKDGNKKNSFKSVLLGKCQDEFQKKSVFDEWKIEKKAFDEKKHELPDSERLEREEDLEFRRMKTKKQVLGNIRFIGELYKVGLLKVKVMRDCIETLLKIKELDDGNLVDEDEEDMDEEDHEAVCKLFQTIGFTFEGSKARDFIEIYFQKIERFSNDKKLPARTRFMYKDLIELRQNRWKARREQETAKTLDEIKQDFEREERIAQQESQRAQAGYRGGGKGGDRDRRGSNRGGGDKDRRGAGDRGGDNRGSGRNRDSFQQKSRSQKERVEPKIDKDGFVEVSSRGGSSRFGGATPKILSNPRNSTNGATSKEPPTKPAPEPMNEEKLKLRAKTMRTEFMEDPNEKELLLSMDETKGSPDAERIIAQAILDAAVDCKDEERAVIIQVLSILYKNERLTSKDIGPPFGEIIEFLDSYLCDSPQVLTYMGNIMAEFLHIGALDVNWLCEQTTKLKEFSSHIIPSFIESCVTSSLARNGAEMTKSYFDSASGALNDLLGSEWNGIASKHNI